MEHIVQFGINIDDETIRKTIEADAKNQVIEGLKDEVREYLGIKRSRDYYGRSVFNYRDIVEQIKKELLVEFKENMRKEVFESVVSNLSRTTVRQKWFREAVSDCLPDVLTDIALESAGVQDD